MRQAGTGHRPSERDVRALAGKGGICFADLGAASRQRFALGKYIDG